MSSFILAKDEHGARHAPGGSDALDSYFDPAGAAAARLRSRGPWAANRVYAVNDLYTAPIAGVTTLFLVHAGYTSASTFGAADTANADAVADLGGGGGGGGVTETDGVLGATVPVAAGATGTVFAIDLLAGTFMVDVNVLLGSASGSAELFAVPAAGQTITGPSATQFSGPGYTYRAPASLRFKVVSTTEAVLNINLRSTAGGANVNALASTPTSNLPGASGWTALKIA